MGPVEILIVDDSPADRAALRIAFDRSGYRLKLHFASSAGAALAMLRNVEETSDRFWPHLLIIDVKMPGISGLELLHLLKADETLVKLPVIMFSGSDDPHDVDAAYSGFASGYIRKPGDIVHLNEIATAVGNMCSNILVFPQR
jgi:two-component system response regulator